MPSEVVGVASVTVYDRRTVSRVAGTAGEVALDTLEVCVLLNVGVRTLLATALPEHIVGVSAPETDRETA